MHSLVAEVDRAYDEVRDSVTNPEKNGKRVTVGLANQIMDLVEVMRRAFTRAQLVA